MSLEDVRRQVSVLGGGEPAARVTEAIQRSRALLPGHFALHRDRHAAYALRFRAIARDREALATIATLTAAKADWDWGRATIVTPESAGFFLGDAIARETGRPHAVTQCDLRRLPTPRLVTGEIERGTEAVIVNDVVSTGGSLDGILKLLGDREVRVLGVMVFMVVGVPEFQSFCNELGAPPAWLVAARWHPNPPGQATCAACRAGEPLIPIAEFS